MSAQQSRCGSEESAPVHHGGVREWTRCHGADAAAVAAVAVVPAAVPAVVAAAVAFAAAADTGLVAEQRQRRQQQQ